MIHALYLNEFENVWMFCKYSFFIMLSIGIMYAVLQFTSMQICIQFDLPTLWY